MTNEKAISALKKIKNYCSASLLDELEYVIAVMEKLHKDGITDPLNVDFKNQKNNQSSDWLFYFTNLSFSV